MYLFKGILQNRRPIGRLVEKGEKASKSEKIYERVIFEKKNASKSER